SGAALRCTNNLRIWKLTRGYVAGGDLAAEDRVLLNDSATPATDASWELPIKIQARSKSAVRGGSVTYRELPERWSAGLGELMGPLVGDGWLTGVQTGWVYGGDDIDDSLLDAHEGLRRELLGGITRQQTD